MPGSSTRFLKGLEPPETPHRLNVSVRARDGDKLFGIVQRGADEPSQAPIATRLSRRGFVLPWQILKIDTPRQFFVRTELENVECSIVSHMDSLNGRENRLRDAGKRRAE